MFENFVVFWVFLHFYFKKFWLQIMREFWVYHKEQWMQWMGFKQIAQPNNFS